VWTRSAVARAFERSRRAADACAWYDLARQLRCGFGERPVRWPINPPTRSDIALSRITFSAALKRPCGTLSKVTRRSGFVVLQDKSYAASLPIEIYRFPFLIGRAERHRWGAHAVTRVNVRSVPLFPAANPVSVLVASGKPEEDYRPALRVASTPA
jgi:hypothetical protein